tara:strand:+ start:310 stop:522 length:213 start_codon:yes stop_codon:yes gene_type:complete
MTMQHKKAEQFQEVQDISVLDKKIKNQRPNIDHLLKRIKVERNQERVSNLVVMIIGIIIIVSASLLFTQS